MHGATLKIRHKIFKISVSSRQKACGVSIASPLQMDQIKPHNKYPTKKLGRFGTLPLFTFCVEV
jgi:hypothetical protein